MEIRRKTAEYYRKIRDRIKNRMKKALICNWPEPSTYCGCCSLSTGIYIRSVLVIIFTIITVGVNSVILHIFFDAAQRLANKDWDAIEEFLGPDSDWDSLTVLYKTIVVYYIMWISFKILYVLMVIWTVYAVYKKNAKMLKRLVYINVPYLIFDFIISFAGSILFDENFKILLIVCVLSEGYNILAMNSEYKKLRGKSRLVVEYGPDSESNTETIYPNNFGNQLNENIGFQTGNNSHCQTCTCYNSISENPPAYTNAGEMETSGEAAAIPTANNPTSETPDDRNEIRLVVRTNDANVTAVSCTSNIEVGKTICCGEENHAIRPITPNEPNYMAKDVIIHISDEPIIYDERQLNLGTSSVFKDV